jgi:hypothetical protein
MTKLEALAVRTDEWVFGTHGEISFTIINGMEQHYSKCVAEASLAIQFGYIARIDFSAPQRTPRCSVRNDVDLGV